MSRSSEIIAELHEADRRLVESAERLLLVARNERDAMTVRARIWQRRHASLGRALIAASAFATCGWGLAVILWLSGSRL